MTGPRDFEVISDVISGQLALPSRHLPPAELEQQAYDLSIVPPTDGLFQIRGAPRAANHAASSDVYLQAGRVGGQGLVAQTREVCPPRYRSRFYSIVSLFRSGSSPAARRASSPQFPGPRGAQRSPRFTLTPS